MADQQVFFGDYAREWEEWFDEWMNRIHTTDQATQEGRGLFRMSNLGLGLGEGCPREKILAAQGEPTVQPNPGFIWMLEQGNRIHEMIQDEVWHQSLEQAGIEVPVEYNHNGTLWTGSADIVTDGHVVDIKTVRGRKFQYLNEPSPANEIQLQGYMMALDLDQGVLLYVDREGQNGVKAFDIFRNDDRVHAAMTNVESMVETRKTPPVGLTFTFTPTKTKGITVRVKHPWQWGYCGLAMCACRMSSPPQDGSIVARIERNQINLEPGVANEVADSIASAYARWQLEG